MAQVDAERFKGHADECRQYAADAVSDDDREAWLRWPLSGTSFRSTRGSDGDCLIDTRNESIGREPWPLRLASHHPTV